MLKLTAALNAWGTADFEKTLKKDIQQLDSSALPLQAGLSQSSQVSDTQISVVILALADTSRFIQAKTGVFYSGIIAGSCCADDPTPISENTEYCELLFEIDKTTAETAVTLLDT